MDDQSFEFEIEDKVYLTIDGQDLLARVYTPRGAGPFPCMIELHGGAWSRFDRTRGSALHTALARAGFVVIALDFRQAAQGAYPKSPSDINYAIRWAKANAKILKVDPRRVGLTGNSSGGHLAMLVAMRPFDPDFTTIALPQGSPNVDATVGCVAMCWPVINPSGRYRYAQHLIKAGNPPSWANEVIPLHDAYWGDFATMEQGNPMLILERGEEVDLPPALWISASRDDVHNYKDPDAPVMLSEPERFIANYRKAGGDIAFEEFEADGMFTVLHPTLPESVAAMQTLVDFCTTHLTGYRPEPAEAPLDGRYDLGGVLLPRPFKAVRLGHFGLWHTDLAKVVSAYVDVLGFRYTDSVNGPDGAPLVAFTSNNTDHHVLVAMDPRTADPVRRKYYDQGVTINQISLQVNSLKEINAAHDFFKSKGVPISRIGRDMPGSNWAVYAFDPDGHRVELFYGMEQLGWNGVSKPASMYRPLPYDVIPLPQPAEVQEVEEAKLQGIDLMSGIGQDAAAPYEHDLEGIMAQRPFKVSKMGPVRIFVENLEASETFYTEIIGLQKTEEILYKGHRCVFLRVGHEHHSVALFPKALRAELELSDQSTLLSVGVQVQSYRQLRDARAFVLAQGMTLVDLPYELHPGIDRAFNFTFDGVHCFQVYFQMDNVAPLARPRQDPGAFDSWPERLEGDADSYLDQTRQGPLA